MIFLNTIYYFITVVYKIPGLIQCSIQNSFVSISRILIITDPKAIAFLVKYSYDNYENISELR